MKPWLKRTLGLLPIVGGGAGLTVVASVMSQQEMSITTIVILVAVILLYLLGIVAGLLMLEGHRHANALNLVFWTLQIPQWISPLMTYFFWAPTNLGVWWNHTSSKVGLSYQVGSAFQFSLFNAGSDVAVAVNLFALACGVYFYLLYRRQYRQVVR